MLFIIGLLLTGCADRDPDHVVFKSKSADGCECTVEIVEHSEDIGRLTAKKVLK